MIPFCQAQPVLRQGMKLTLSHNLCMVIPTSISPRPRRPLQAPSRFPTTTLNHKAHAKAIQEGITLFSRDPSTRLPCPTHPYSHMDRVTRLLHYLLSRWS